MTDTLAPNVRIIEIPFGTVRAEFLYDSYEGKPAYRAHVSQTEDMEPLLVNAVAYVVRVASFMRTVHFGPDNERLPDAFNRWPNNQYVRRVIGNFQGTLTDNAAHKLFQTIADELNRIVDTDPDILKHACIASLRYEAESKRNDIRNLAIKLNALQQAANELETTARRIEMELEGWPATVSLEEAL